jgi:hypothetical protein
MPCLTYYCLCLLFNKISGKGRTGSAWKQGGVGGKWGGGREMAQTMYAHMNKQKKEQFVDIYSLLRL